ncbi:MAG: pyridoxal phosphate-dependent aminotransferase [Porphyrobacter sp.]|nr:pyridoxal phosphate-dependent aminotransferase [Porphyrobacter sp.]
MDLPPFLLNDWLESRSNLRFNLAGSTGPRWTMGDLVQLGDVPLDLADMAISYAPPAGTADLRAEIAAHHDVDPDWVVVTNGASEAFLLLLQALSRVGGNVLLPMPAYPAFTGAALSAHLEPRYYQLRRERQFRIDLDQVVAMADGETVLAVANSPQNPTGALLGSDDCKALGEGLREKGVSLLVDEVFHPVYFGEANPSAAGIENVIVIGDMSKAFSMPGLRIGWIVDQDAERRARIIRARSYLSLSGSPMTEALALHALRNRSVILDRVNAIAAANFEDLRRFMSEVDDILGWVPPEAGMLAFPWFRDGRDSRAFCEHMADKGVFLSPGDCFGMPEHMRIGFGSQTDGIALALKLIAQELHVG